MSKPRINLIAYVDNINHALTISNSISSRLAGMDVFEIHSVSADFDVEDGSPYVSIDVRFNRDVDRDNLKSWLIQQVRDHSIVKTWVTSARISTHKCTHDDDIVRDCNTTELLEWSR